VSGAGALIFLAGAVVVPAVERSSILSNVLNIFAIVFLFAYVFLLWWGRQKRYAAVVMRNPSLMKSNRRSIVTMWFGIGVILFSLLWVFISPALFDVRSSFGAVMDLGGALFLGFVDLVMISFRAHAIWTIFVPEDPDQTKSDQ
jgi:hypothetical protein